MDRKTIEASEALARKLFHSTRATALTVGAINELIIEAIKIERARVNKRLAHPERQIGLLRIYERGRAARELADAAHAEADE